MFEVAGFLGVTNDVATKIVNVIDAVGYGVIAASAIATILSAGSLAASSIMIDACILTVKDYLKRNLKAQAVLY